MRAEAAAADRCYAVRKAAHGWRRAGAIDDATLSRVEAEYPDDRVRLGPGLRGLAFVFTALAVNACFLLLLVITGFNRSIGPLALLFGAALCFLTEVQTGAWKRADAGAEKATELFGLLYLLGFAYWLLEEVLGMRGSASFSLLLALGALTFAAGAVRWGSALSAALATGSLFGLLAQFPEGRWLWILAALILAPVLVRGGTACRLAPSERTACQVALALALIALYLALHIGSWDSGWVESLPGTATETFAPPRPFFVVATGVLPLGLLALGVRARNRLLLDSGLLLGIVSLVTLRFYVHVAPVWVVLTLGGAAAILAVLGLRRWLEAGTEGERGGFTAKVLFEDPSRQAKLEAVVAVVGLTPAARTAEAKGFEGAGGRSGGGGATDSF